ncbi:hypothetical protein HDV63DRAFT_377915 [Trichoderma sp. SZMC 28014]
MRPFHAVAWLVGPILRPTALSAAFPLVPDTKYTSRDRAHAVTCNGFVSSSNSCLNRFHNSSGRVVS